MEVEVREQSYIKSGGSKEDEGGHGGGGPILLEDLFGTPEEDEFNRNCRKYFIKNRSGRKSG